MSIISLLLLMLLLGFALALPRREEEDTNSTRLYPSLEDWAAAEDFIYIYKLSFIITGIN